MTEQENLSLSTPIEDLESRIMTETDIDELNNIIDIFNVNIRKKEIVRNSKLSNLQDKVFEQMSTRIEKHGDEFSNKDLLDYYKTLEQTLSKSDTTLQDLNTPQIQVNQQVNINTTTEILDRESRLNILDAVNQFLTSIDSNDIINEVIEEDDFRNSDE